MGMDLMFKIDLATGERAMNAFSEFGRRAKVAGWGRYPGVSNEKDYDYTEISCCLLWRGGDPALGPFRDENDNLWGQALIYSDPDQWWPWDPENYPANGECVLAWDDIPCFSSLPVEAMKTLHDLLEARDALPV